MEDYEVGHQFLMQSLSQPLIITVIYLLLVVKIGPYFMANKKQLEILQLMTIYNVLQIICNSYAFVMSIKLLPHFSVQCNSLEQEEPERFLQIMKFYHMGVMLKFFDLIETLFFVLRKKTEQVSFLHLYHHVGVVWTCWLTLKYFARAYGILPIILNSFAHTFMYIYYLQSSRGRMRNTFWKKCLTGLQIGHQIGIFFVYIFAMINTKSLLEKCYLNVTICYGLGIVYMFLQFYKKSYDRKSSRRAETDRKIL